MELWLSRLRGLKWYKDQWKMAGNSVLKEIEKKNEKEMVDLLAKVLK